MKGRHTVTIIAALICLASLHAAAQTGTGAIFDTPDEERGAEWQKKRDSIARLHHDEGDLQIVLECSGDVLTGYAVMFDTIGCHRSYNPYTKEKRTYSHYKMYHVDDAMHKVRQVVALREKWPNTPDVVLAQGGGYKLAAVTPREYIELDRADAIYGEEWDICYPGSVKRDSVRNVPGYEIVVLERGYETVDRGFSEYIDHSKELMSFTDTVRGEERKFLCVAYNPRIGYSDYRTGQSLYGIAESNFVISHKDKNDYWWRKHFDDLRKQQKARALRQRMWTTSF